MLLERFLAEKRIYLELGLVFFLVMLRFSYYGFSYFPQLDDYIQYYTSTLVDFKSLVFNAGMLASRPLAGPLDILFWSHFWDHMYVALMILSFMWSVSAVLFRRIFNQYFSCGIPFLILYAMIPLGFEGTYWISASTRIVTGMFFSSISLSLFESWISKGKKLTLILWFLCVLFSFCFYEQILVLSFVLILLSLVMHYREKRAYWGLFSFLAAGIYFLVTSHFKGGNLSERMSFILPSSPEYFDSFLPTVFDQFRSVFGQGSLLICGKGFLRGLKILFADGAWLYVLFVVIGLVLLVLLIKRDVAGGNRNSFERNKDGRGLLYAAVIAIAPCTPFLIIANPWFSLRSAVVSFVGLALFFDILIRKLVKNKIAAQSVIVVSLAVLFLVGSVSELHDYKKTYENDQYVASILRESLADVQGRVGILNLNASYLNDQNFYYHEHIHGATESEWALTGLLDSVPGGWNSPDSVVPLATDTPEYYIPWNGETKRPDGFDALFWFDFEAGEILPLVVEGSAKTGWVVSTDDGKVKANIYEDETGCGFIEYNDSDAL